ncbi:MAG: hypothetical protein AB8F94_18555 [Saprospiraceae bacterium]
MKDKKQHIGDWLEQLQRESWNLELLVSGFSIFLLIQASEGMLWVLDYVNLHISLNGNMEGMLRTFIITLILASWVLTFNLIVHVFLRGFWIGTVGLRSVQSSIDLDEMGYSEYFTEKLKKRVPTLDQMLERLDTLSSVIFAFTFLVVFMMFSLFLFFSALSLFTYIFIWGLTEYVSTDSGIGKILFIGVKLSVLFSLLIGFIYFIDTLSLGFFKRYKWISKIYYPFYRVIGVITMAGIYRSIYYSLISRFSKNKIRIALGVYLIMFFLIPFFKFDQYIFYPDNSSKFEISSNAYDDLREEDEFIRRASIPSQFVKGNLLPLFIRYQVKDNTKLTEICEDFKPEKTDGLNSGISFKNGNFKLGDPFVNEKNPEDALECLKNFYSISIDSTLINTDFYFYTHPNREERGIFTMLQTDSLAKGKHEVFINKKAINKEDEIIEVDFTKITFWKE